MEDIYIEELDITFVFGEEFPESLVLYIQDGLYELKGNTYFQQLISEWKEKTGQDTFIIQDTSENDSYAYLERWLAENTEIAYQANLASVTSTRLTSDIIADIYPDRDTRPFIIASDFMLNTYGENTLGRYDYSYTLEELDFYSTEREEQLEGTGWEKLIRDNRELITEYLDTHYTTVDVPVTLENGEHTSLQIALWSEEAQGYNPDRLIEFIHDFVDDPLTRPLVLDYISDKSSPMIQLYTDDALQNFFLAEHMIGKINLAGVVTINATVTDNPDVNLYYTIAAMVQEVGIHGTNISRRHLAEEQGYPDNHSYAQNSQSEELIAAYLGSTLAFSFLTDDEIAALENNKLVMRNHEEIISYYGSNIAELYSNLGVEYDEEYDALSAQLIADYLEYRGVLPLMDEAIDAFKERTETIDNPLIDESLIVLDGSFSESELGDLVADAPRVLEFFENLGKNSEEQGR